GDSRVYRMRGDAMEQLTEDHTVVQQWVREGRITPQDALTSRHRHMVTQAVGTQPIVHPTLRLEAPTAGDVFVLTSDGVRDQVPLEDIARAVREAGDDLEAACFAVIDLANARGGRDNSTVVLVHCRGPMADDEPTQAT